MASTILNSVQAHGGRTGRYGEFTIVYMHGCTFITTPMEYMQQQNWARARVSSGNPARDRTSFVERFETVLGRSGSGVATRGSRGVLTRIVKAMKASSIFLEEWMVPRDLGESMEMKRPKGWVPLTRPGAPVAAVQGPLAASAVVVIEPILPAADETAPAVVEPALPK